MARRHGSEKMWGDLRGGKKSVNELRGSPDELTVTLQVRVSDPALQLESMVRACSKGIGATIPSFNPTCAY